KIHLSQTQSLHHAPPSASLFPRAEPTSSDRYRCHRSVLYRHCAVVRLRLRLIRARRRRPSAIATAAAPPLLLSPMKPTAVLKPSPSRLFAAADPSRVEVAICCTEIVGGDSDV
ncbi:hypothetical protein LINPERHAP2_LOCUS41349, partial [Linum perenne]